MQQLTVDLGDRSYPIQVGAGLLEENPFFVDLVRDRSVAIVTDSHVDALFGGRSRPTSDRVAERVERIVVAPGEADQGLGGGELGSSTGCWWRASTGRAWWWRSAAA